MQRSSSARRNKKTKDSNSSPSANNAMNSSIQQSPEVRLKAFMSNADEQTGGANIGDQTFVIQLNQDGDSLESL